MDCNKAREQLSALIDNALSPSEHASLLEHLKQCHSCQHEWQSLQTVIRMVRTLPEISPPADFRAQLYRRLQEEAQVPVKQTRSGLSSRWYQWSIAAAAVLMLVWSARFISVKPTLQRPGETGSSPATNQNDLTGGALQKAPPSANEPITVATPPLQQDPVRPPETNALAATQVTHPATTQRSIFDHNTQVAEVGTVQSVTMTGVTLTSASPPLDATDKLAHIEQPMQVMGAEDATIQTNPNPSFTVSRNALDGDRHRDDSIMDTWSDGSLGAATVTATRHEETVTRLRISGPGPDELRRRLRQMALSQELEVIELTPNSRVAHFSVRGSSEQIKRILTQISTFVTVVERETEIVDLSSEWSSIQEIIARLRLEISRREELFRLTKISPQVEREERELQEARMQLQSHEKTIRLLEMRFGTILLEIGY